MVTGINYSTKWRKHLSIRLKKSIDCWNLKKCYIYGEIKKDVKLIVSIAIHWDIATSGLCFSICDFCKN